MRYFESRRICKVSPEQAWKALCKYNLWIKELSTVSNITWDNDEPFVKKGRKYLAHIPEGIGGETIGKCTITKVIPRKGIHISTVFFGIGRSELDCEIVPKEDGCEIVRRQSYPGFIGFIFSFLAAKRESEETNEYLQVWEKWAEKEK